MRLSIMLLLAAVAVLLAGALLAVAGLAVVAGCLVTGGGCLGGWALFRDDGTGPAPARPRAVAGAPTLAEVLERALWSS